MLKKIIIVCVISLEVKLRVPALIFVFFIIWTQTMYSNLIIGLYQFNSAITRGLFILNEIIMLFVVYVASAEYLNESFDSEEIFGNIFMIWLIIIRLYLFSTMINFNTNHRKKYKKIFEYIIYFNLIFL